MLLDHEGEKWELCEGSLRSFYQHLHDRLQQVVWNKASEHWCGAGLQLGVELTSTLKHIQQLRKSASNSGWLAMLESTMAASVWTGSRLLEHGLSEDGLCLRCHQVLETPHHRYWQCICNQQIGGAYDANRCLEPPCAQS